jgi:hypothetical protein
MISDPVIKKGVIASIIASVFFVFLIQPLLFLSWNFIIFISRFIYIGYTTVIYQNAALGQTNGIIISFIFIFIAAFTGFVLFDLSAKLIELFKKMNKLVSLTKGNIEISEENSEKVIDDPISFVKEAKRSLIISFLILILLTILLWFILVIPKYAEYELVTSFHQRITILSPKISDIKYKELKSKWAIMKNRNDYLKINDEMDDIAKQNGIALPKPLLK